MKKTVLCCALFTLISAQVQAEESQILPPIDQATQQPAQVMNCDYKIPAEIKKIDQTLIVTWSEKAVIQAFEFTPELIDTQIQKLQACFTEPGWVGFNNALEKSGNIKAIKSQKMVVSSQIDGQTQLTESKDNQWKITLPLQVVYQNDKEKITQLLTINLVVGRKVNGDLGILQMIAAPRTAAIKQSDNTNAANAAPVAVASVNASTDQPEALISKKTEENDSGSFN